MKVQLQLLHQLVEVASVECHHILGNPIGVSPSAAVDCLEDTNGSCGQSVKALAHMVCMALCAVLKEHLPWLRSTRQVLQLAQLAAPGT